LTLGRWLYAMGRRAEVTRRTREVTVRVVIDLDGGEIEGVDTGIPFFNHMVETLLYYMGAGGRVEAREEKAVDDHHIVEDVALALGEAIRRAAGARVKRFGHAVIPMDEVLVLAAVDYSGRPYSVFQGSFTRESIGGLSTEMIPHFYWSLASSLRAAIHVVVLRGGNNHHVAEASFKAVGAALGEALKPSEKVFTTKGVLDVVDS